MRIYTKTIKRILDIVLCSFALLILSPLFLVIAIAIKISSPGPVFYYSERSGIHKKPFRFYKFRSMHQTNNDKGMFVADVDRVFRVGKILRRLKLDELPQLVNVIKGDMSIVGPRPMVTSAVNKIYSGEYSIVTEIRPGLTSAASLYDYTVGDSYENNEAYIREVLPIKLKLEKYYVEHQSLHYDTQLVLRTIWTILAVLVHSNNLPVQPELKKI